jgi:hypothetical protein
MKRYLISIIQPDGEPPPPAELNEIMRQVNALQNEMKEAGVWVFAAGLESPEAATVLRANGSQVLMTDGPYLEGKEHIGGFTIIEVADLDAALEWGRKVARIITLPIEIRPMAEGHC